MKNIKTYATIALLVVAVVILITIVAWSRVGGNQNNNSSNNSSNQSSQQSNSSSDTTTTTNGTAGELGPNVVALTADTFNSIVVEGSANKLVVAEAYAPWCPHCQFMGPIVLAVAKQFNGKVEFAKMNSDYQDPTVKANYNLAISKNMQGYPTFWFYKGGKQVYTFSGQETQAQLVADVQKYE